MAKKGKRIVDEIRETLKVSEDSDPEAHGVVGSSKLDGVRDYLPRKKPPCPRCGTFNTVAYRTVGLVQYRKCRSAICRYNYSCVLKISETRT